MGKYCALTADSLSLWIGSPLRSTKSKTKEQHITRTAMKKVIVITGASSGFGALTARALAKAGQERFCQEDRVRIRQPRRNLQIKFVRPLSGQNDFVAYVDATGRLDDRDCLLEWKTTSARYPTEPDGLLALDPQLICYSWITGISEVAQVVFIRKRLVEIQYLRTTITDEQRREFSQLV